MTETPRPVRAHRSGWYAEPETVLAVVPTLDEENYIESTLDQLMTGAPELSRVRIIVADGGSRDATRALVSAYAERHPNVRLIDNPDQLQSAGVNRAVELCAEPGHRILVRCDAHSIYPPSYILQVASSLVVHDVVALATVMDAVGDSCFQKGAAWAVDTKFGSGGSGHRGGTQSGYVDHGHHAGFRLDMWRKAGGYAADFATNEDAELDHRIRQAGGKIWLDAEIRIGYKMRPKLRSLARQYWHYGRGRARTVMRHRMRPRLRQVLPAVLTILVAAGLVLWPLWTGFLAAPLGYAALLAVISASLAFRHRSVCGLWAGPALGAMHLWWGSGFLWQLATGRERQ